MRDRRIEDHVLAWAYSADFPVRVSTAPKTSLQGLTFTRGGVQESNVVAMGRYVSPFFAGPAEPDGPQGPSHTLEQFKGRLNETMPVPSIMLGVTGSRGQDVEGIMKMLGRGAAADRTQPRGAVHFVTNTDVRSKCRDWQFSGVRTELETLKVQSEIRSDLPESGSVLGVLCPYESLPPGRLEGLSFLPGSFADHLTSYAGILDQGYHSKCTEWLRAGATASAGAVTEPYANWRKFPSARLFVHYASGCTLLESLFQSICCPLQLMVVGEPLASPWAPRCSAVLVRADDEADPIKASFHMELSPAPAGEAPMYLFFLDGRLLAAGDKPDADFDASRWPEGWHMLRAVAYLPGTVRPQVFADCEFELARTERRVAFEDLPSPLRFDLFHPARLKVTAGGEPLRIGILCNERLLAATNAASSLLAFDPRQIGPGSVLIQPYAEYRDAGPVRGRTVLAEILSLDEPPAIQEIVRQGEPGQPVTLSAKTSDPENDPVYLRWWMDIAGSLAGNKADRLTAETHNGGFEASGRVLTVTPSTQGFSTVFFPDLDMQKVERAEAAVSTAAQGGRLMSQVAAIVFDGKDASRFSYFGLFGDLSAWALGECRDGKLAHAATRGAFIQPGKPYRLAVRRSGSGGVECFVDNELIISSSAVEWGNGSLGLLAESAPARFESPKVSPPCWPESVFQVEGDALRVTSSKPLPELSLRVSDGHRFSEKAVRP